MERQMRDTVCPASIGKIKRQHLDTFNLHVEYVE